MGTCIASGLVAVYALWRLWSGAWVISIPRGGGYGPNWSIIRSIFKFGLPTGIQGIAMNVGGVFMLAFIGSLAQSAAAQGAYAVSYTELFSLVTWTSVGLMGAAAAVAGQNLGAGKPDRANAAVHVAAQFGFAGAAFIGIFFLFFPRQLLAIFGMHDPAVVEIGVQLLRVLSVSGSVDRGRADLHGRITGHRRHAQSAIHLDHLADHRAAGYLFRDSTDGNSRSDRYLAGDPRGPCDALCAECDSVQAREVEEYRSRVI